MKKIKLTKGLFALVDAADFGHLDGFNWYASNEGRGTKWYAIRKVRKDGKQFKIRMHREIMRLPVISDGRVVDHLNGDGLDNRKCNLEITTQEENMRRVPTWTKRKTQEVSL